MLVFLSILAAGILLLTLIFFLHRLQYREKVDAVDRTLPLPPLDGIDKQRVLSMADTIALDFTIADPADHAERDWLSRILSADRQGAEAGKDWLSQSRLHALNKDYERALMSCAKAFPQMGAYRQAAQLIRARIRELRKTSVPWEQELKKLYLVAAWADLMHGNWEDNPGPSPAQLKGIDLLRHQSLPMNYNQLGYLRFSLLGKNDIKLLSECWGEPSAHLHAREIHGETLQRILNSPEP